MNNVCMYVLNIEIFVMHFVVSLFLQLQIHPKPVCKAI